AAIGVLAIVDSGESFQVALHTLGQCLIRSIHRGEQGIAAARRAIADIEDAAHWRLLVTRHIAVPALPIGARRILVSMDNHQLGVRRRMRRGRMKVQLAEATAEIEMLLLADMLVAEEDHQVFSQRAMDLLECLVAKRLGEINAANLCPNDGCELVY